MITDRGSSRINGLGMPKTWGFLSCIFLQCGEGCTRSEDVSCYLRLEVLLAVVLVSPGP
jgi:hypothetical protein